ncbi:ATP-binding protein [Alishewanella sp. SMS8]|uniref:PAS domain-containing sensor histidine kinase n=1 Tax=Alishewanella sp. SMS8 TaxID=2994676 RepID=UPI002742251D|nr:ATP-binding protein [Alishewanella sp. SMS8]MDP5458184.1 ATP-binding protein [Alishewanella sp. SMS8]
MKSNDELDALPCPVIVTDLNGLVIYVNQCALTTFAIATQADITQIEQLFPPAAAIFLQTHVWPMLRNEGLVKEFYLKVKRTLQPPLPVLLNIQKGLFQQQACYRWVILPAAQRASFEQELLSTRQQLQQLAKETESHRYILQAVLDGAQDVAIMAVSAVGIVRFVNRGAEMLLGTPSHHLINSTVMQFLTSERMCTYFQQVAIPQKSASPAAPPNDLISESFDTVIYRSDGQYIDVQLHIRQLDQTLLSEDMEFIILMTDIRQRKHYEKLQNDFIANISHELRTPLTAILGSLHLLNSGKLGDVPEKVKKLIDITEKNSNRLKYLITNILDFSKLKATKMSIELQTVFLQPLLKDAVAEHRYYLPDKKIQLELEMPEQPVNIVIDPQRFMQVMANLLSNAIKFSVPDSRVKIVATLEESCVVIAIEDQGPGITAEFLPYIFTQFSQQDSVSNRHYEGSGLGLAISKSLVELMGGAIGYRPGITSGAVFWFSVLRVHHTS